MKFQDTALVILNEIIGTPMSKWKYQYKEYSERNITELNEMYVLSS